MLLDASTAKSLFTIIMLSTQGVDALKPEPPLQFEDRGDAWLVKGTPYDLKNSKHHMSYMFFRKDSAEVIGMLSVARMVPKQGWTYWSKFMTRVEFERVFGPATRLEPGGIPDIVYALYGGLINKPTDAIDYASVLMQTKPELAKIPKTSLEAKEIDTADDKIWHVTRLNPKSGDSEILSFSRKTGRLLSGDL
jgi:hypothetical protein